VASYRVALTTVNEGPSECLLPTVGARQEANVDQRGEMPSDLIAQLERWARERRILPRDEFDCAHYPDCQESRRRRNLGLLERGRTCMMSYIGIDFGAMYSGKPFRLAIVGMDHGESAGGDFAERQSSIELYYYNGRNKFNQHYRGVIRTAAAILGEAGQHCLDACKEKCEGDKRLIGMRCVLRSFAQPNVVKCVSAGNMTCQATSEMYDYCSDHLLSELDILKPDLAVFHGRNSALAFLLAEKNRGQEPAPFSEAPKDGDMSVVYEVKKPGFRYIALFLAHPSRGHLSRRWETVAGPALDFLRSCGAVPP